MDKTRHIALVSEIALFHPDFDNDKPGVRLFARLPPEFENGPFHVFWIEHGGMRFACFRFDVWAKTA